MLTEEIYRTEITVSFELSRVYTAPVVRLWWMIVVSIDFLNFRNLGFGPFCRSTPPHFHFEGSVQAVALSSTTSDFMFFTFVNVVERVFRNSPVTRFASKHFQGQSISTN